MITGANFSQEWHASLSKIVMIQMLFLLNLLKKLSDEEVVKAFQTQCKYLTSCDFKPKMNILDNAASHAINEYIKGKK